MKYDTLHSEHPEYTQLKFAFSLFHLIIQSSRNRKKKKKVLNHLGTEICL